MRCNFEKRGEQMVCVNCGLGVPIINKEFTPEQYHANCGSPLAKPDEPQGPCIHFGEPTGEIALIQCETCQGNVRQKFAVHRCEVFATCLPEYRGVTETGHGCIGCEQFKSIPRDSV